MKISKPVFHTVVLVVEKTKSAAKETCRVLEPIIARCPAKVTLLAGTGDDIHTALGKRNIRRFEPCLAVTDREGVLPESNSVMNRVRKEFGKIRAILYSRGASEIDFQEFQNAGLVDAFVRKPNEDQLETQAKAYINDYFSDEILNFVREKLCSHPAPSVRYITVGERDYSAKDIFLEILHATPFGLEMRRYYSELLQEMKTL